MTAAMVDEARPPTSSTTKRLIDLRNRDASPN